jgi:hypothetical protein
MIKKLLLIIPCLMLIAACSEPIPPKLLKERDTYRDYEVHYEYQTEQWDDPDILSTPRLQFTWVKPGDAADQVGVWTMKFDGTDLRELVKPEELMPDHLGKGYLRSEVSMVRSPNNRYIPYAVSHAGQYDRRIFDLKTREVTVIVKTYGPPRFQWFKGNRFLKFGGPGPMMVYDLENKKLSDIGTRFTESGYLEKAMSFDKGNQVVNMDGPQATFYDFDTGKLIKKIDNTHGVLTLDNRHWLRPEDKFNVDISSLGDPNKIKCRLPNGLSSVNLTGINADGFIFSGTGDISKVKCKGGKRTIYSLPGDGYLGGLTIYNAFPKNS